MEERRRNRKKRNNEIQIQIRTTYIIYKRSYFILSLSLYSTKLDLDNIINIPPQYTMSLSTKILSPKMNLFHL